MSDIDREWETGEWPTSSAEQHHDPDRANDRNDRPTPAHAKQMTAHSPARTKARPAPGKQPSTAQAAAIASINERYRSDLNDEVGF